MRFYHVAGTNGKGSVTAALAAMLTALGRPSGRFISPHLERPHERVSALGRDIDGAALARATARVRAAARGMPDPPTEFELWTGIALLHFLAAGVTDVAWETGLGGRYDATNAVRPEVAVITSIGLDHMDRLGDTLAKIAWEKAGILKAAVPAVTGALPPEAMAVVEATAERVGAPLWRLGREITIRDVALGPDGTRFRHGDPLGDVGGVRFGLVGPHQAANAALALAALRFALGPGCTEPAVSALAEVSWPGRFELVRREPPLVLDGAHNPDGARALAETWRGVYGDRRPVALFGCLADRDPQEITAPLDGIVASWHTVAPGNPRRLEAAAAAQAVGGTPHAGVGAGLDAALEDAAERGVPLLCFGSLYLIGELRALLRVRGLLDGS
jgi:dihydrofolate synthase/folylpolyglutamate synthase